MDAIEPEQSPLGEQGEHDPSHRRANRQRSNEQTIQNLSQVTIITSVASDLPPALADRRRAVQVLGNLVRNALRHTPEGGLIAVRAEQEDGRALVIVEDTGEGIPPDRLPRVFERFYRGDDARDRASGGAGLGLAIVHELVEAMGGDVSVESTVGLGSRFSFRLPLAHNQR